MDFSELSIPLSDDYPAYARYWAPTAAKGAVVYHHGIQSHSAWYEESARSLARAGYAVLQCDRRGCGRNERQRGHAESADQLIADAFRVRDELARRSGFSRQHVMGVSWGGRLAVAGYVVDPAGVTGLSLITPGLFPRTGVTKEVAARIGFAMLYETERLFDIPLNRPELLTSQPGWQEQIARDPLALAQATAGFYLASRRMDKLIANLAQQPPVPLRVFLAGDEGIIDNAKTEEFVARLGWPGAGVTRYDDARHTLEYEPCAEAFLRDLVGFVDSC